MRDRGDDHFRGLPSPKVGSGNGSCSFFARGYCLVTRNVARNNALWASSDAKAAVEKELGMLLRSGAFDFAEVMEEEEARRLYPEGHFVSLDPLLAVKHAEPPEEFHVLKCRVVAGGDRITTGAGEKVSGTEDVRAMLPASLAAVREVVAYGASIKGETRLFDVEGAYVQSALGGPPCFGRPNRRLWPRSWASRYWRPVLRVWRAIYGMPRSGFDWDDRWSEVCYGAGLWKVTDTEGSLWVFTSCDAHGNEAFCVIALYVDDGVASGPPWLLDQVLGELGRHFTLKLQSGDRLQLLGMHIAFYDVGDRLLAGWTMEEYLAKLHSDFVAESGETPRC